MLKNNPITIKHLPNNRARLMLESVPNALIGIQFLWQVVYKNTNEVVVKKAVLFLVAIHLNVNEKFDRASIISEFIGHLLSRTDEDAVKSLSTL
jgi:hypothetical protein